MKYSELLAEYQAQVDRIDPDNRPWEVWVELLIYLENNCSRQEDTHSLFKKVEIKSRWHMNPSTAMLVIKRWVESTK